MPLTYSRQDVYDRFEDRVISRGENYFSNGNVLNVGFNAMRDSVYGTVRGSGNKQYNVHVRIEKSLLGSKFVSTCTCPVRLKCKHAVALLLAAISEQNDKSDSVAVIPIEPTRKIGRDVENWLETLEQQLSTQAKNTSRQQLPPNLSCLLYIINVNHYPTGDQLWVNYVSTRQLKTGGYGKESRYDPYRIISHGRASFIGTDDEQILRQVYTRKMLDHIDYHNLSKPGGGELLAKMIATGRCHWKNKNSPAITAGEPMKGLMQWHTYEDASQRLILKPGSEAAVLVPSNPPSYFIDVTHQCGPLLFDVPNTLIEHLQQAPRISVDAISDVSERLRKVVKSTPAPVELSIIKKENVEPKPSIRLCMYEPDDGYDNDLDYDYMDYVEPEPAMEVKMDYAGVSTSVHAKERVLTQLKNNSLVKIKRNMEAEKKYLDQITKMGIASLRAMEMDHNIPEDLFALLHPDFVPADDIWIQFMLRDLPVLREHGWQVFIDKDFPFNVSEVDEWQMDVDDTNDNQWFDLELGIMVNGKKYDLIRIITQLIHDHSTLFRDIKEKRKKPPKNALIPIGENELLAIPFDRIWKIVNVLMELFDSSSGQKKSLRLPQWRAAELNELQEQGLQWQGGEKLKSTADKLANFKGIKAKKPPKNFKAELRKYQQDGLGWMQFLREYGFHGVLADDMGLGKTVQALAHIATEKKHGRLDKPVLVIAPTSLMYNWRHEAEQFTPNLTILTLHGPDRKNHFDEIANHDIVLSTYPLLGRDDEVLLQHEWHMLILDEAQNIKNPKAKASKIACQLNARHRLCLTGTPMENHLGELWSMFNFLMPGLLGDQRQFRQLFRTPIEKQGDTERAQRLAKRLAPFMLRRKKDDVLQELPPKTEIIRSVALEGVQRDLYETVRISMQKKVRDSIGKLGINRSHIIVLDALLKLRQICCDPRLLKSDLNTKQANSAKLDLLVSLLPELLEEGRRILLFSQFTSMLRLIEEELKKLDIKYVKLTGSTRNREKPIAEFQNGEVPLFLISLKAGGTGLNLTSADTVIHYDPWWNPAVEAQATDRAHRMGQDKPVFVYKLITEATVETRIQLMQESKRKLAEGLFDNAGKGKLPSAKDLEALFEPLGS